jgi:antitoxin MazE
MAWCQRLLVTLVQKRYTSDEGPMIKKLSAIGNDLGVMIDGAILDLLDINQDTPLEVKTDGEVLIIRPLRNSRREQVLAAAHRVMDAHEETFRKLAE